VRKEINQEGQGGLPLRKDDVVCVSVRDIGSDGSGIGKADGFTLFIKDAVVGDVVTAKIMKVKKGYGFARLQEVKKPSPFRVAPVCPIARKCGGCQLQELSYEQQLIYKEKKVHDVLTRIGGVDAELVNAVTNPTLGMENPWRFRNKEQLPIGMHNGRPAAGFYAGRTHCIVPVEDCLVGAEANQEIMEAILHYMEQYHVPAYDEETGKGLMRHVLIRNGRYTGEIMVCLVVNGTDLPHEEKLIRELCALHPAEHNTEMEDISQSREQHSVNAAQRNVFVMDEAQKMGKSMRKLPSPRIACISLNINTARTNVIMGEKTRTLWGSDTITDIMHVMDVEMDAAGMNSAYLCKDAEIAENNGTRTRQDRNGNGEKCRAVFRDAHRRVTFRISPLSFYQVNPIQAEKLYSLVRYYAGLTGKEIVWDLYCGVGTIGCFLAADAKEVYGVEIIPDAVRDARKNAEENGIANITFHVGKAEEVVPAYVEQRLEELGETAGVHSRNLVDVVVVDPPRKGCDEKCLETILQVAPERIVYVSCDPATMARDCRILAAGGYELRAVQPVDQFPHTVHIETVCLLVRRNSLHIDIDVDVEEMLQEKRGQATYAQIKDYVLEQNGLKVSSLYISQVKRKCGLDVSDSYNKPRSEEAIVPQCPPEKEEAIMNALRHFGVI
jgi:23S rRNA (uracil1939-C5)-methyltransferase